MKTNKHTVGYSCHQTVKNLNFNRDVIIFLPAPALAVGDRDTMKSRLKKITFAFNEG